MNAFAFGHAAGILAIVAAAVSGCSAGDVGGGSGSGNGGTGANGGLNLGDTGGSSNPGGGNYCQDFSVDFTPQTPTVFVLVDRSGTMFEANRWTLLRDAVLPVIAELETDVRFGIGAYNSVNNACGDVIEDQGTIAQNHYAALESFYNGLSTTIPSGKLDTPTSVAIGQAVNILNADNGPGAKAILLVTSDDDPDYCDDVGPDCGNDGAVGAIQAAYAAGVSTFVFGLDNAGIEHKDWFDFWAQAGVGEEPNWTTGLTKNQYSGAVRDACTSNAGWKAQWTAAGRSGFDPIGLYSDAGGTAKAFVSADTTAVAEEIRSKVQGLKSCTFDLTTAGVQLKSGASGEVFVADEVIPRADWKLNSSTSLELLGASCEKWKDPAVTKFFAGFTCEQFIK